MDEQDLHLLLPDGREITCHRRISSRAKTIRLRLIPPDGKLEIVLPRGIPRFNIRAFLEDRIPWIAENLRTITAQASVRRQEPVAGTCFPRQLPLLYLGGMFTVTYEYSPRSWTAARCDLENRVVRVVGDVLDPGKICGALKAMIKLYTERHLLPHFEGLAEKFGFKPGHCTIRIQKGRWGSCSSRGGAISLNALLLLLPDDLVEYILIHELCHLRQMNHSALFWKEVETYCPDYRHRRRELRKCEKEMSDYFC